MDHITTFVDKLHKRNDNVLSKVKSVMQNAIRQDKFKMIFFLTEKNQTKTINAVY